MVSSAAAAPAQTKPWYGDIGAALFCVASFGMAAVTVAGDDGPMQRVETRFRIKRSRAPKQGSKESVPDFGTSLKKDSLV